MIPPVSILGAEYKWAILLLALAGSYAWGRHDGGALAVAAETREAVIAAAATAAAQKATAEEIAKLEVKHVTVQRRIERETREVPVYRDCRHSPDGLRAINDALENRAVPPGDRELPAHAGGTGQ